MNDCLASTTEEEVLDPQSDGIRVMSNSGVQEFPMKVDSGEISLFLVNSEIWEVLYSLGHEMLINNTGRNLRPDIRLEVQGLKPEGVYHLRVRIAPVSPCKMIYRKREWDYSSQATMDLIVIYEHPESPNCGQYWLDAFIVFDSVKVHSHAHGMDIPTDQLTLDTRRKYQVMVEVEEAGGELHSFEFVQLQFITVTSWHSKDVKEFKVKQHTYSGSVKNKALDEVDKALVSGSVPPVYRMVNSGAQLNPNGINILCKPPKMRKIHKIGIIEQTDDPVDENAPSVSEVESAVDLLREEALESAFRELDADSANFHLSVGDLQEIL